MSKEKANIPKADILMGSMRSMGYSFEAAIADVIDNSISARCSTIKLLFPKAPHEKPFVGILDDGDGMSSDVLFEAMRYGSSASESTREDEDLGRFGLGMKSASLSQCRILTVVSKCDKKISGYTWDYNFIKIKQKWMVKEHTQEEIEDLPCIDLLKELDHGTFVLWRDFDVLAKSSDGQVFDSLCSLQESVYDYVSLIFHRFLGTTARHKISIYVNKQKVKPQDPFLESHPKTTFKKERTIALSDSKGVERIIRIKPFILPFATDLSDKDKKLVGGIESLRARQGFYIYRNNRLIIWGTWFGMKPRAELTKNARIRVDIPNTLDDIWSIDIKKQNARIPKRIQNQLKNTVNDALEISVKKQTHRGRKEKVDDNIDYIWDRMEGRDNSYYYQINRESKLYQFVREKMSEDDFAYFDMFLTEVERNIPTQQMYIDKANDAIEPVQLEEHFDDVFQTAVTMADMVKGLGLKSIEDIINDLMLSEPFCNYKGLKDKLLENYEHEVK